MVGQLIVGGNPRHHFQRSQGVSQRAWNVLDVLRLESVHAGTVRDAFVLNRYRVEFEWCLPERHVQHGRLIAADNGVRGPCPIPDGGVPDSVGTRWQPHHVDAVVARRRAEIGAGNENGDTENRSAD